MPIYEFSCEKTGQTHEKFMLISEWDTNKIICPIHFAHENVINHYKREFPHLIHYAEKIFSIPAKMELGKPTLVMVNPKTGEKQVMASSRDKPKRGWVVEELKSTTDRTRFENEQNANFAIQDEVYNQNVQASRDAFRKEQNAKNLADMSKICAETDNPSATEALMKAAMNRKPKELKKRKSVFRFNVNHNNKSNLT